MRDRLPFFVNNIDTFKGYKVVTEEVEKEYIGSKDKYTATVTTLVGISGTEEYEIFSIHTDRMTFWDAKQTEILKQITEPLNDFESYRWEDIKKPLVDYWLNKQELSETRQKKQGAKTVRKPGGNYALWSFGILMSFVLLAKMAILDDDRILDELEKEMEGFEADFTKLVLEPLKTFSEIKRIRDTESDHGQIPKKIVDVITAEGRNRSGLFQDILNPDFQAESKFLDRQEARELNSLFGLYDRIKEEIESDKKLNDIEKKSKVLEFWETPQGKRLNELNSRISHGGGLKFEEKEHLKHERILEISSDLEEVLRSWNLEDKYVRVGLQYYQDLYEKEVYSRYEKEKTFRQMIERSQAKLEDEKAILTGIWDDSSLNFIGILVGIAIGFGLSIASFADSYQWLWGIGSAVGSFFIFTLLFKWNVTKRPLLKLSRWVLKDRKSE